MMVEKQDMGRPILEHILDHFDLTQQQDRLMRKPENVKIMIQDLDHGMLQVHQEQKM